MMRTALILVTVSCGRIGFDPLDPVASCPATYSLICGGCYKFHDLDIEWLDAENICETEGTHLAVFDDATEQACLAAAGNPNRMWVGATDRIVEGLYLSVTGSPQRFTPFATGQPESSDGQDCLEFRDTGWADENCTTDNNRFFCEHDGLPVDPASF